jgi:hypothetical protein
MTKEEVKEADNLSLGKFLKGFFSMRNISKAIVFGVLFLVIQYVAMAVWGNVKPQLSHIVKSRVEGNAGTIESNDSHDAHKTVCGPLSVLFGSCGGQT